MIQNKTILKNEPYINLLSNVNGIYFKTLSH